ncbi:MAG: hypothetical protein ABIW82_12585 [Dokdonella sp.]
MKRSIYLFSVLLFVVATSIGAFVLGVVWGRFQGALEENKIAIVNLDHAPNLDPQFREYLKARVYWNVRMFYPANPGYLIQKDWDRGAVDEDVLGEVAAAKDPTVSILNWQNATNSEAK